jgi:NADH:ubiquinone oxidoreductase subunit 6 (subunit J)
VIVVALIVSAFKKMIDFEVNNSLELLALCGCVAMLALSAWLIVRSHSETESTKSQMFRNRSLPRLAVRRR